MLPSDDIPRDEEYACQGTRESYAGSRGPIHGATQDDSMLAVRSDQPCPSSPLSPPKSPPSPHPRPVSLTHHTTSQHNFRPRIPLNKPPEVETLLNSQLCFIPLLLWISHGSGLAPRGLPLEHAYSCMGLFFISDLHVSYRCLILTAIEGRLQYDVNQYDVSSTTGFVQGRVCWSVTLQWAPGGEDALVDCYPTRSSDVTSDLAPVDTRDLLHPWWFDPTDTLSHAENTSPYRPRDLQMQFFSFIPLDFLAEFHPSESFPRGWLCKSCGMINVQEFFRHQLCQSTVCRVSLLVPLCVWVIEY